MIVRELDAAVFVCDLIENSEFHRRFRYFISAHNIINIEVLNVKVGVSVLLLFASLPDCSQYQTAVSDTLH